MNMAKLRRVADHVSTIIGWHAKVMTTGEVKEAGHLDPPCPLAHFSFGPFWFMIDADGLVWTDDDHHQLDPNSPPLDIAKAAIEWIKDKAKNT